MHIMFFRCVLFRPEAGILHEYYALIALMQQMNSISGQTFNTQTTNKNHKPPKPGSLGPPVTDGPVNGVLKYWKGNVSDDV